MLVTGIYAGLAYTAGHAFAPAVSTPYQVTPALSAWPAVASRVRMSAAGGTETVDIELGKIVNVSVRENMDFEWPSSREGNKRGE